MQRKLNWEGFSNKERIEVIEEVKKCVSLSSGWIIAFTMFSDLALSLSIEIEESGIQELHSALSHILTISDLDPNCITPDSKRDLLIFMNISFVKGTGNMKTEIPEVLG